MFYCLSFHNQTDIGMVVGVIYRIIVVLIIKPGLIITTTI